MILLIDNYDSFVHNLARYLEEMGTEPVVVRNDVLTTRDVAQMRPEAIILSPGPCTPHEAGITLEVIRTLGPTIPMLGVCLGHQAIGVATGATLVRATTPMHGRTSLVDHTGAGVFTGLAQPLRVMRYHSLVLGESQWPDELTITARTTDGTVMGVAHRHWPLYGVQFHPESILTQQGHQLISNFLTLAGVNHQPAQTQELPPAPPGDDFYGRAIGPDAGAVW